MGWVVSWSFKNVLDEDRLALFTTVYSQTSMKTSTVLYANADFVCSTRNQVLNVEIGRLYAQLILLLFEIYRTKLFSKLLNQCFMYFCSYHELVVSVPCEFNLVFNANVNVKRDAKIYSN